MAQSRRTFSTPHTKLLGLRGKLPPQRTLNDGVGKHANYEWDEFDGNAERQTEISDAVATRRTNAAVGDQNKPTRKPSSLRELPGGLVVQVRRPV